MDVSTPKSSNITNVTQSTMLASGPKAWSMGELFQYFGELLHGIIQYFATYPVAAFLLLYLVTVMGFIAAITVLCRRFSAYHRKFAGLQDSDILLAREIRNLTGMREEIDSGRITGAKRIQYNFSFIWELVDAVHSTVNTGNRSVRFLDNTLSDSDISLTMPPVPVTPVTKKSFGRIRDSIGLARHRLTGPKSAPPS